MEAGAPPHGAEFRRRKVGNHVGVAEKASTSPTGANAGQAQAERRPDCLRMMRVLPESAI